MRTVLEFDFFFKRFKIVQAFLFLCLFVNFWNLKSIPINFIGFKVQGIPAFCDFTIHDFTIYDPHDFVSGLNFLNSPLFHFSDCNLFLHIVFAL